MDRPTRGTIRSINRRQLIGGTTSAIASLALTHTLLAQASTPAATPAGVTG